MAKVLIVYGTTEGQTEKIVGTLVRGLRAKGHTVDSYPASSAPSGSGLALYDGIIVGSSVHKGRFNKIFEKWSRQNSAALGSRTSAFFSVCLGILEKTQKALGEERKIVEDYYSRTDFTPKMDAIFAGALKYSKYGWLTKQMMKWIVKRAGQETDTSRDYEYTDWAEVEAFSNRFSDMLASALTQLHKKSAS